MSDWVEEGAVGGYVAASEWRNVQVEEPRVLTSGGQSVVDDDEGGGETVKLRLEWENVRRKKIKKKKMDAPAPIIAKLDAAAVVVPVADDAFCFVGNLSMFFNELHDRHLYVTSSSKVN